MKKKVTQKKESFVPSKRLREVLREVDQDLKCWRNFSPVFTNMKDMDDYSKKL